MENEEKRKDQKLKTWEAPVLKFEELGSTLGGPHPFVLELSGNLS